MDEIRIGPPEGLFIQKKTKLKLHYDGKIDRKTLRSLVKDIKRHDFNVPEIATGGDFSQEMS